MFRGILAGWIPDVTDGSLTVEKRHSCIVDKYLKGFVKRQPPKRQPEKTDFTVRLTRALYKRLELEPESPAIDNRILESESCYDVESENMERTLPQAVKEIPKMLPKGAHEQAEERK